ncbi:MAG: signal peptidase I [Chloroflexota bacterium]
MDEQPAPNTSRVRSLLREVIESILPALVIVLVVNIFLAQATRVEGLSMEPSLHNNQRLIIEKISYRLNPPQRGDIVVLRRPNRSAEPLIKRVVGLPGETVTIHDGRVYINDESLNESYLTQQTWGNMAPKLVPEEHLFVLGDNRQASNDSRVFGMVPMDDIIGRAWLRYWPPSEIALFPNNGS